MSLVSTYVRAVDGKLYRDPVVAGDGWFLCFDDDDPPELVVRDGTPKPSLSCIRITGKGNHNMRCFTGNIGDAFEYAQSYWCRLVKRIPVPTRHHGVVKRSDVMQGVFYDLKG